MAIKAIIKTAGPLGQEELNALCRHFEGILGDKIEFTVENCPSLIGGFAVYVDGKIYDASMSARLNGMLKRGESVDTTYATDEENFLETVGVHLKNKLALLETEPKVYEYGEVQSSADGVVHINGLGSSLYGELLEFNSNAYGIALELSSNGVGAVLLNGVDAVTAGSIVRGTGRVASVGVGDALLGRVIDPIGRPLDGKPLTVNQYRPIECPAPSIMDRAPVNQPLQTGLVGIDSMIPIGKGQRELIIGDRQTGKTAIALSAILNQSKKGVICVYCAIGQKASTIAQFTHMLESQGALSNSVVVASAASDCAAMQYIAPYAACSIAEYFMYSGRDALVVYDDLSKHAASYRAMSLLLRRPPGREAYPGDVFYLHSRLLERAAKLKPELGGGSITALPIVETMAGDISAYIPTNVISITDGQIYLESELFNSGVRPAVNIGLSVSRVGRAAQPGAMKRVSGQLRLDLAQYREMSVFAQFGSDIDSATKLLLDTGERLTELLKQDQNTIYQLSEQVAILLAFSAGFFERTPIHDVGPAKEKLLEYLYENDRSILNEIENAGELTDAGKAALINAIEEFKLQLKSGAAHAKPQ